jgi:hypothetical protein
MFGETEYPRSKFCSGGIFSMLFGGGGGGGSKQPMPKPQPVNAAGGAVTPGTSSEDYKKQQTAYYQQMLAGLGQGTEGGQLPAGMQTNIDRQASLLK